jgi:hypothetical protein
MKRAMTCCLAIVALGFGKLLFEQIQSNQSEVMAQEKGNIIVKEPGLVGYWPLRSDCNDHAGKNHGTNHGVKLDDTGQGKPATFNGIDAYIEVPNSPALQFGTDDFSISASVYTEKDLDDVIGDVLDMYDPVKRRGITLAINSSAGGYQGQGNDRHVYFGIDNGKMGEWKDCGRPNPESKYVNNSLSVYKGKLYAATSDGKDKKNWAHVYRYEGDQKWVDCGRVGDGNTTGVSPLIVHNDNLYAVTCTYDWTRVNSKELKYEPGRMYRYDGDNKWIDCGQPSNNRTVNCAVSYKGKIYVGGGPNTWGVFVQDGENTWKASKLFPRQGEERCFPHAMSRYNGKLYVSYPCVYSFDGNEWKYVGLPDKIEPLWQLQSHSLAVYQGKLIAGTWPEGNVSQYQGGDEWKKLGRVGEDGTEVMDLLVYNGQLYGCSIPRAEVCRYDGDSKWTSLKRFYSPEGWTPEVPGKATTEQLNEWARVTSMTIYDGKLFASTGNCTSAIVDSPEIDTIGKVFCLDAGRVASDDNDLGPGWKHIAAVRENGVLKVYVNGKLAAKSTSFKPEDYDVSTDKPLRIGFGQIDYFCGKMVELRMYNTALSETQVKQLASVKIE